MFTETLLVPFMYTDIFPLERFGLTVIAASFNASIVPVVTVPVPVRLRTNGDHTALFGIVILPVKISVDAGANTTENISVPPAATDDGADFNSILFGVIHLLQHSCLHNKMGLLYNSHNNLFFSHTCLNPRI